MNMLLLAIFFYVPACELAELGIAADAERVFLLASSHVISAIYFCFSFFLDCLPAVLLLHLLSRASRLMQVSWYFSPV